MKSHLNSKRVIVCRAETVANTLNRLTKTARKSPKIGVIDLSQDNVKQLFLFIDRKEIYFGLACL